MSKQQQQSTALVPDRNKALSTMEDFLGQRAGSIARIAPKFLTADRVIRVFLGACSRTPKLLECTPSSVLLALMDSAFLGLEPNPLTGHGYLVPFRNNKKNGVLEAQFITGYRGMILLAHRSGAVVDIEATAVHERDVYAVLKHMDPPFRHEPYLGADDPGPMTNVYSLGWMKGGHRKFLALTKREVEKYRARSRSTDEFSPWNSDYEAMARKTVIRRLCGTLPVEPTARLAEALAVESDWEVSGELANTSGTLETAHQSGLLNEATNRTDDLAARLSKKAGKQPETTPPAAPPAGPEDFRGEDYPSDPRDR